MANPFTVNPAQANLTPVMSGVGNIVKQNRAEQKRQQGIKEMRDVLSSRDPIKIADFSSKYPELQTQMKDAFGFTNKASEEAARTTYRRVLSDPDNANQYLQEGIQQVIDVGGTPNMMTNDFDMMSQAPEEAIKNITAGYAGLDPAGFKALFSSNLPANEKMTPYQEETLALKREASEIRKLENKSRQEDNLLKRKELEFRLNERIKKSREEQTKKRFDAAAKVRQQTSLSDNIDSFLDNDDYINSMSGYTGRLPTLTTTGIEAEAYFDNIKNNLTLENLDKMSGVLSETDIKILSTAATALQPGMSKKQMVAEMKNIKEVLSTKSADVQAKLMGRDPSGESSTTSDIQQAPPQNQQGWNLMIDANGNKAYVSPDGQIEEVQ